MQFFCWRKWGTCGLWAGSNRDLPALHLRALGLRPR